MALILVSYTDLFNQPFKFILQFFDHVEEAVWAVEVLKTSGKPVASTLCISPHGDKDGIVPGECAVRLVKAGTLILYDVVLKCLLRNTSYSLKYQGQS